MRPINEIANLHGYRYFGIQKMFKHILPVARRVIVTQNEHQNESISPWGYIVSIPFEHSNKCLVREST